MLVVSIVLIIARLLRFFSSSPFWFSTRVSNELGAGNPQAARVAVFAVLFLAVAETSIVSTSLLASRRVFGYTFSNEKEVVDYVTTMAPLISLSIILDSIQGVLSG
jgi:MATE family multidrug resistance protein